MQSSHNGYLSGLSPYVPHHTISTQPPPHQLHAAHHSIMPPPQNLDTSFQFAYHPNGYSTIHPTLHHNTHRTDSPLIAGYAPAPHHPQAIQPPSHQLVSQPWPLGHHHPVANQLGHLHTIPAHHSMQTSPTASNITPHHQSILQQQAMPAVPIIQNCGGTNLVQQQQQQTTVTNISRPNTPSSSSNVTNSNLQQQQIQSQQQTSSNSNQANNANLAQLNTNQPQQIQQPQPSVTPTAIHQPQTWYSHPYSSTTPVPHPSSTNLPHQAVNPAFSQAHITFGYPTTGYVPAGTLMPTHWQHQNPYLYGN